MESTQSIAAYESKYLTDKGRAREYFAIAPMVDVTDKYYRYLMRHLTKHAFLYTEMINENAVVNAHLNPATRALLDYTPN
jgi:tRNA-dihydrouridine synthase A